MDAIVGASYMYMYVSAYIVGLHVVLKELAAFDCVVNLFKYLGLSAEILRYPKHVVN